MVDKSVPSCPVCSASRREAFNATVRDRHHAVFAKCDTCGFLGAADPTWLDEAYLEPITAVDTGVLARSLALEPHLICLAVWLGGPEGVFLDAGGGYGVLVRHMRDVGLDFRWRDPHCENLLAKGFELAADSRCDVVTAIEVIEHSADPVGFLSAILEDTSAHAIVFTTELLPTPVPSPESWWYYAWATGQHVSFFERRTLDALAEKLGLKASSRRNIHVLHDGRIDRPRFLMATTRFAKLAALLMRMRLVSLTDQDNPLLG